MVTGLSSTVVWNGTTLDSGRPSRYSPNTTMDKVLEDIMVETWNWTLKYADYYRECGVEACSYTVPTTNDRIFIVTTVIGVMGGIWTAFKLMVPKVVFTLYYVRRKWRNRAVDVIRIRVIENKTSQSSEQTVE